jgi:pyruvate formate lyase activating enzyme
MSLQPESNAEMGGFMSDDTKGLVFNIVHGSFVDGYGIRTTIFLKGCPLRCIWCCNPEGQSFSPELKVMRDKCNGCGRCIKICKQRALSLDVENKVVIDREKCAACLACVDYCYTDALDQYGVWHSVDEIFEIIQRDKSYYAASGGGATIGGGEATWQPQFLLALLKKCRENQIHTAIDTCGYVSDPLGIECLKTADLLLFDIKGFNSGAHEQNTGVPNDIILENLHMLSDERKPMIIRLPLIPNHNDSEENLTKTAELLASLKSIERVDIIPLHQFGKVKYDQIGMDYCLCSEEIPDVRQDELRAFFEKYGLKTQIGG